MAPASARSSTASPKKGDRLSAGAPLVEGYLDADAVTLATGDRVVSLAFGGTAVTEHQVAALGDVVDLTNTTVVVATDNDHAGRVAATRAWHLLGDAGVTDREPPISASTGIPQTSFSTTTPRP